MRRLLVLGPAVALLLWALPLQAKLDPLKVITERLVRSEILIVLDTSGSMLSHPSPATSVGTDCGGDFAGLRDLCGDGMCTGSEGSTMNVCWQDCPITSNSTLVPGDPPACNTSKALPSRMYMVKRVLRNLLPDLRQSAAFGLVTFNQSGYFVYHLGSGNPGVETSVWFSRTEMEQMGAWDASSKKPKNSFTWHGTTYKLLSKSGLTQTADSLYSRSDDYADENRFDFSTAGLLYSSGGSTWIYRGSYYAYEQAPMVNTTAYHFSTYYGPQFVDSFGDLYVYYRVNYSATYPGFSAGSSGLVVQPLVADQSQTAQDQALFSIMQRLNMARNGGLLASGGTPTGAAINVARLHYIDRQQGTGIYSAVGADPAATCRGRFVLLLTDGQSGGSPSPESAASTLYWDATLGSNHVKTVVVGLPGLPASAMNELDDTADYGDDGKSNNSKTAYYANDETTLTKVVKEALFEMVKGDYTTTASGATSSGATAVLDDVALLPSTEYPGWKGHLKAMDMSFIPPKELWDAGKELNSMEYKNRKIFTGFPDSNSSIPVPLLAADGTVNLDGSCSGCGGVGVRDVWADSVKPKSAPIDTDIISTVEWVVGKGRSWRLGPVLRSTPATVGPPPKYEVANHKVFKSVYASRERLIYITSNDGILHAFRAKDGSEAFGFVPPNLWTQIHALWQQGGQDVDPTNFKWILASSPRVEDIPEACTPCDWKTQLVLTMGPGGPAFTALNITNPSVCTVSTCTNLDPPFRILAHSRDLLPGISNVMGETWSVPTLFYAFPSPSAPSGRMGMGSGYDPAGGNAGDYYSYFTKLYTSYTSDKHNSSGAKVDFALVPHPSAAVDYDNEREIIATYQANPNGYLLRYDKGDSKSPTIILNEGADQPLFFSPAVWHKGSDEVLLAQVSGSQEESKMPTTSIATLFMRSETNGTVSTTDDFIECQVHQICSGSSYCPDSVPTGCTAPSSKAQPVGQPIILKNELTSSSSQYEAFFVFYDPPSSVCATGSSWLIRISTNGTTQTLMAATEYVGVRATGLTVVGGGLDVVITASGYGGKSAFIQSALNNIGPNMLLGDAPYVEVWKEVK